MKNQLKRSGIVSLILIVLLIVFTLWQSNTHAVEMIFSRGWYPVFSYIPGTFSDIYLLVSEMFFIVLRSDS